MPMTLLLWRKTAVAALLQFSCLKASDRRTCGIYFPTASFACREIRCFLMRRSYRNYSGYRQGYCGRHDDWRSKKDALITRAVQKQAMTFFSRKLCYWGYVRHRPSKGKDLEAVFGTDFVQKCKGFIESPGISVLREAEIAVRYGDIHSMHYPTEGGLATGLSEIARAADVGLIVEEESIPVFPECRDAVPTLWNGSTRSYSIRFFAYHT